SLVVQVPRGLMRISIAAGHDTTPYSPVHNLIPYTTLFRSLDVGSKLVPYDAIFAPLAIVFGRMKSLNLTHAQQGQARERLRRWLDRKSTRLNSSHVKISYAVFCLRKKTKVIEQIKAPLQYD